MLVAEPLILHSRVVAYLSKEYNNMLDDMEKTKSTNKASEGDNLTTEQAKLLDVWDETWNTATSST